MSRVHTCVNCRNSVGLDDNQNYFSVSLGHHRGRYTVCYACWLLEPLRAARSVLHEVGKRERGVVTPRERAEAENNLAYVASREERS